MRLKNKKTGEIGLIHCDATMFSNKIGVFIDNNHIDLRNPYKIYSSLAELNSEWEDYEESEPEYYITGWGEICEYPPKRERFADRQKEEIGNYFLSKEEAEEAVEKLKAWKRLKDKGFMFILDGETEMPMFVYSGANGEKCITSAEESKQCRDDIKLLFGGEE